MMKINKLNYMIFLKKSNWPFLMMLMLVTFFTTLDSLMKLKFGKLFMFSMLLMMSNMIFWFKNFNDELIFKGMSMKNMENCIKFFIIIFILSEMMIFFSFFWSYFNYFFSPTMEIGLVTPMKNYVIWSMNPMTNTLILMYSSITVSVAHENYFLKNFYKSNYLMMMSIILGMFFTLVQIQEYYENFFTMKDSTLGSIFYNLTGLHGVHVIIGTFLLIVLMTRSFFFKMNKNSYIYVDIASWYWHFVDLIWIFVYYFLYYLPM